MLSTIKPMVLGVFTSALIAAVPRPAVLTFQVYGSDAVISQTAAVMRKRLSAVHLRGVVKSVPNNRVEVILPDAPPWYLDKLLTTQGRLTFRIVPHGDTYRPVSGSALRDATADEDQAGNPIVTFRTANPSSFYRFTRSHLNQSLGIYLDGHLLASPVVVQPISDTGEIVGKYSRIDVQLLAAIIGSGAYPAPVSLISLVRSSSV